MSHERLKPYSFRTNYSVNSQAFVLVAILRISLVKFTERKSALLQNNNAQKKNSAFCSVLQGNPAVAWPKEQLYEQMTYLIQPLQREICKKSTLISYVLVRSKNLWSRITLYRACTYICVWLVNTLTSTTPIGSPKICMWSPADICKQFEFSRRSWGRKAWRTPKNVCMGG